MTRSDNCQSCSATKKMRGSWNGGNDLDTKSSQVRGWKNTQPMSNLKLWNELRQLTCGMSEWQVEICEGKLQMLRMWHNSFRKRQKNGCGEKERPHALNMWNMWIEWQSRTWQNGNGIWTRKWSLRVKFYFLRRMLRQDNNHQLNSMVNWHDQSMTKVGEEDEVLKIKMQLQEIKISLREKLIMRSRMGGLTLCSFLGNQMDVRHQSIDRKSRIKSNMDRANECLQGRCRRQRSRSSRNDRWSSRWQRSWQQRWRRGRGKARRSMPIDTSQRFSKKIITIITHGKQQNEKKLNGWFERINRKRISWATIMKTRNGWFLITKFQK